MSDDRLLEILKLFEQQLPDDKISDSQLKDSKKEDEELKKYADEMRKRLADDHKLRHKFSWAIFCLIIGWLLFVEFIILSRGFCPIFHMSDAVMIAFLTSTTTIVVGIFVIVAKWIFKP